MVFVKQMVFCVRSKSERTGSEVKLSRERCHKSKCCCCRCCCSRRCSAFYPFISLIPPFFHPPPKQMHYAAIKLRRRRLEARARFSTVAAPPCCKSRRRTRSGSWSPRLSKKKYGKVLFREKKNHNLHLSPPSNSKCRTRSSSRGGSSWGGGAAARPSSRSGSGRSRIFCPWWNSHTLSKATLRKSTKVSCT